MAMAGLAMIMMATQWQYVHNPDGNYDNSMTCLQWSWRDYEEIIAAQNGNTAMTTLQLRIKTPCPWWQDFNENQQRSTWRKACGRDQVADNSEP